MRPFLGFGLRVLLANALLGVALAAASHYIDWVGLQALWALRVAAAAGVLGCVALLYFAVLAACGLRPRQFMRLG